MRKLAWIAPFVLIALALAATPRLLALIAGIPFMPYNESLEGARILAHREALGTALPADRDILMAGSSRMMADFDPAIIAQSLARNCAPGTAPSAYNAGNIADDYGSFLKLLARRPLPKLLVLEYSPHMLLGGAAGMDIAAADRNPRYRAWRQAIAVEEAYTAGAVEGLFGLENALELRPGQLSALWRSRNLETARAARTYYLVRSFRGYGTRLTDNGHVLYRVYFPDREAAELIADTASEYERFAGTLAAPVNDAAWHALQDIVGRFDGTGKNKLVIVRPPVAADMYALESRLQHATTNELRAYLAQRNIPYIDLNPNAYYSTDRSHIDWYDTARASTALAQRVADAPGVVDTFGAADCRP